MPIPKLKEPDRFTYADYLTWPNEERWELIDGEAYDMSPGPEVQHQRIVVRLSTRFAVHLEGKPCQVFVAPLDVRPLATSDMSDDDVNTVVQPDLIIVCDKKKLEKRGVVGAPDLVVEILSPFTARKDISKKFDLYELAGVREYWVVFPNEQFIQVYRLVNGVYGRHQIVEPGDVLEVSWLDDFKLDVTAVFAE